MTRRHAGLAFGVVVALSFAAGARAQGVAGAVSAYDAYAASVYGAPGNFGVAYGSASYGVPRTWSAYSSSYGPGYAIGYQPTAILPGPYGMGIWGGRPGFVAPGYVYGSGFYRTFPVPIGSVPVGPVAPLGAYAPGFGPPAYQGW